MYVRYFKTCFAITAFVVRSEPNEVNELHTELEYRLGVGSIVGKHIACAKKNRTQEETLVCTGTRAYNPRRRRFLQRH